MKILMKKPFILVLLLLAVGACKDDITELNQNPKRATTAQPTLLFSNAQKEFADALTNSNVNLNIFRLLVQHWTQTTYIDESQYDLETRSIPENFWNNMYRDVLRDLREARVILQNNNTLAADVKQNQLAILEVMEVYSWAVLVNTYGNIPYSEALNPEIIYPRYESGAEVYNDIIRRLDAAIASMKPGAESFGTADLMYGGEVAQWVKFANSLKLKLGMTLADADPAKAKTLAEQAAPNVFVSNADNAVFTYLTATPNTNPIWVDLVQSGRQDYVAANTFVDALNTLNDPRRQVYFTPIAGSFKGGTYGTSNNFDEFSKPGTRITTADFEGLLLDYAEVEFFLAEAVERGFNVGGTAAEHYNNAIRASMEYWGVASAADAYLAQPEVNYATAPGDFRQKIGTQKWIALYNRGFEAWTEWRRLDAPKLEAPEEAVLATIPVRFPFPAQEQNVNTANYNQAASDLGADTPSTKVFWDKF